MTLMEQYMEKEAAQARLPGPTGFNAVGVKAREVGRNIGSAVRGEAAKQKHIAQSIAGKGPGGAAQQLTLRAAGQGAAATALLGGGALAARKLFARKSGMQRFKAALKNNRGKIMAGAGAAGAAGGIAAFLRNRNKNK